MVVRGLAQYARRRGIAVELAEEGTFAFTAVTVALGALGAMPCCCVRCHGAPSVALSSPSSLCRLLVSVCRVAVVVTVTGLWTQLRNGFASPLPFPLSVLLWPLNVAEWLVAWAVHRAM